MDVYATQALAKAGTGRLTINRQNRGLTPINTLNAWEINNK
jgi:hypothetical protein